MSFNFYYISCFITVCIYVGKHNITLKLIIIKYSIEDWQIIFIICHYIENKYEIYKITRKIFNEEIKKHKYNELDTRFGLFGPSSLECI